MRVRDRRIRASVIALDGLELGQDLGGDWYAYECEHPHRSEKLHCHGQVLALMEVR